MSDTVKTIALIKALAPAREIDPEQVKQDVEDWLDDHPEATTTVEDGAITKAKLNASLQGTVDDVDALKSEIADIIIISPTKPSAEDNKVWIDNNADSVQVPTLAELLAAFPKITLSSQDIASFADGAKNIPVESFTATVGTKVAICGKNFLAKPFAITNASLPQFTDCFPIKAGNYYMSFTVGNATSWRLFIRMFDAQGNYASDISYRPIIAGIQSIMTWNTLNNMWLSGNDGNLSNHTLSIPKDCYVAFGIVLGNVTSETTVSNAQLESGSSATSYEAYRGYVTNYNVDNVSNIKTLYGVNNIYADNGQISVTYCADIGLYFQALTRGD